MKEFTSSNIEQSLVGDNGKLMWFFSSTSGSRTSWKLQSISIMNAQIISYITHNLEDKYWQDRFLIQERERFSKYNFPFKKKLWSLIEMQLQTSKIKIASIVIMIIFP